MTSFAEALTLVTLAAGAPGAAPDPVPVTEAVAARIAEEIAARWSVPASRLRFEWGRLSSSAPPDRDVPFRIVGKGADGWFVVVFDPSEPGGAVIRLRAGVEDTVPVSTRPLDRGATLAAGDLEPQARVRWGPPVDDRVPTPREGWEVRRPLAAGEVLEWPAVVAPLLVTAGRPVLMVWARGAVSVTVTGIATNSARGGEVVRARVDGRRDRLIGIATAEATATLGSGGNL